MSFLDYRSVIKFLIEFYGVIKNLKFINVLIFYNFKVLVFYG